MSKSIYAARSVLCLLVVCIFAEAGLAEHPILFSKEAPSRQWHQFAATSFERPVSGVVYQLDYSPCCGVPLGGVSTGCIDIDPQGVIGFCTIFNGYPREPKRFEPFLGLSVEDKTWVLASERVISGGLMESCVEPGRDPYYPRRQQNPGFWHQIRPAIRNVEGAQEIEYWGHYPVADLQYRTSAPIDVALRAWSPFVPGNVKESDTPAAVFEVKLRNRTDSPQSGSLAISFNAPMQEVKRRDYYATPGAVGPPPVFARRTERIGEFDCQTVSYEGASYVLGAFDGEGKIRHGGALGDKTWARFAKQLPEVGDGLSGTSCAVDFELAPHESKTIRYMLAWFVPTWGERGITWHRMNALEYPTVEAVAQFMTDNHKSLLRRILGWQGAIYAAEQYPVWLRDMLVNSLALITETGYYAQPKAPLGDWCAPDGLFGMIEAPRVCPQIECIPCSWYGNMPLVYFYPELARTTLRGYKHYQREDGAAPFCFGPQTDMWQDNNNHAHDNQIMLNGVCFVDMVYRLWQRTGELELLEEFYDAVKRSTTLTATMGEPPFTVVGFPPGEKQTEWWEGWPWTGIATHAAGMHLSNLLLAEDMAVAMGDNDFAEQCRRWFEQGSGNLEEYNWWDGSYLLFHKPQTGVKSDKVMSNQLDAVWANAFLGIDHPVFRPERIDQALCTIRETCLNDRVGAVSFASRDGQQELTTYGIFPPETLILGMTYLYRGDSSTGMKINYDAMRNMVLAQGKHWDMTNMVNADTGGVRFGTDYYQMMILWALPVAIDGQNLAGFCADGGLVTQILEAAQ